MTTPRRPAAYIGDAADGARRQMTLAARRRRWAAPVIYAESGEAGAEGQALARLSAAITAGQHDGVLMAPPGDPSPLFGLLLRCTRHGVTVSFVTAGVPGRLAASTVRNTAPDTAVAAAPVPVFRPAEPWDILASARLEALESLFPDWRIWLDQAGWHARRRDGFLQSYRPGAPVFSVRADSATDLAAQLCWQVSADEHAPDGCQASIMPPAPWGSAILSLQPAS